MRVGRFSDRRPVVSVGVGVLLMGVALWVSDVGVAALWGIDPAGPIGAVLLRVVLAPMLMLVTLFVACVGGAMALVPVLNLVLGGRP